MRFRHLEWVVVRCTGHVALFNKRYFPISQLAQVVATETGATKRQERREHLLF